MKALLTSVLLAVICGCSQQPDFNPNLADELAERQRQWQEDQANLRKRRQKPAPPAPYFTPDQIIDIR